MILSIITAVICLVSGAICFSPYFRKVPLLRPLAVFLLFEGVMQFVSYIVEQTNPTSMVPTTINRIGTILILLYFLFIMFMTRTKSKRKDKEDKE